MSEAPAIEIRDLRKKYVAQEVLRGVDLSVARGEILGYVGPNGSGKTTTVRILCGLLGSFDGEVRVAGFDPRSDALEIKRRIGYVPENAELYEALTVAEFLLFIGRMHGLEDSTIQERAGVFLENLDLATRLNSRISALSKGMRQKVLITSGMMHRPEILFMDEPLAGLDVNSAILIKKLLRGYAAAGRAIFFSSHVMDVVERLCDRIAILHDGVIAAEGTFEELSSSLRGGSLEGIFAELTGERDAEETAARILEELG